jgi:hypothetical protein
MSHAARPARTPPHDIGSGGFAPASGWAGCRGVVGIRRAGRDYWDFWLHSGPLIGLATAAFGLAWGGLDRNPGLVSADPLEYAGAALQVAGLPLIAFGGHMQRVSHQRPMPVRDTLLLIPLAIVFGVGIIGWLVLIAPAQYFAFLVAGAVAHRADLALSGPCPGRGRPGTPRRGTRA